MTTALLQVAHLEICFVSEDGRLLGIMLILLFSVSLGWLPASGYVSPFEDLKANLAAMILPAFVLGNAIDTTGRPKT